MTSLKTRPWPRARAATKAMRRRRTKTPTTLTPGPRTRCVWHTGLSAKNGGSCYTASRAPSSWTGALFVLRRCVQRGWRLRLPARWPGATAPRRSPSSRATFWRSPPPDPGAASSPSSPCGGRRPWLRSPWRRSIATKGARARPRASEKRGVCGRAPNEKSEPRSSCGTR